MQFGVKTLTMITLGLAVLAVIQVTLGHCVDNEHVVNPLEAHHQHLNCPHSPGLPSPPNPEAPCDCGCSSHPCTGVRPSDLSEYPLPCIQSLTKLGGNPWAYPYGPVLQSAIGNPLCCDPLVPVVRNHVGHRVIKVVKHVPVVRKYCKPELVIRTRNVPVVRHKKRIFLEPYTIHIPVTDKLIRNVIHQYLTKVPVVHKCVKPYTFQTVHHVPSSVAKCLPPCSPCDGNPLSGHHPYPLGPFPPTASEGPSPVCPQPCDPYAGNPFLGPNPYPLSPFPPTACEAPCAVCPQPCDPCAQAIPSPCPCPCQLPYPPIDECPCPSPSPCKP